MKKLLILMSFVPFLGLTQKVYFSNQHFPLGDEVDESKCKTEFSDDEKIYGLVVLDQDVLSIDKYADDAISKDGRKYRMGRTDVHMKLTRLGEYKRRSCRVVGYEGKSYIYMYFIPEPAKADFYNSIPKEMYGFYKSQIPLSSAQLFMYKKDDGVDFKSQFKITKSGKMSPEKLDELASSSSSFASNLERSSEKDAYQLKKNEELTYEDVKLRLDSKNHGPGTLIDLKISRKKNGVWGDYYENADGFKFELEGCNFDNGSLEVNSLPFGSNLNEKVSIKVINEQNPSCQASIDFELDYGGTITKYFTGSSYKTGQSGSNYPNQRGGNGQNGRDGDDAPSVDVFITKYKPGYVLVKFDASNRTDPIYSVIKTDAKIMINNYGGSGAHGGSGGSGSLEGQSGGDGGHGGNGGKGGTLVIHILPELKSFESNISWNVSGGRYGKGGRAGSDGKVAWSSGNDGQNGADGQSGPKPKIIFESVKIEIPNL